MTGERGAHHVSSIFFLHPAFTHKTSPPIVCTLPPCQNRIALLKKEEQRAWRKIQQTKKRADEIIAMRRENEQRLEQKQLLALQVICQTDNDISSLCLAVLRSAEHSSPQPRAPVLRLQAEEKERELADEHLRMGEEGRRARAKNLEEVYMRKRGDVLRVRQERQLNRAEVRQQQAEDYNAKREMRSAVKKREEDFRLAKQAEQMRVEKLNEDMYLERVREKELAARRKQKEVGRMEKMEMQLIQKLKNTQQLQQRAFYELENALNGDVA